MDNAPFSLSRHIVAQIARCSDSLRMPNPNPLDLECEEGLMRRFLEAEHLVTKVQFDGEADIDTGGEEGYNGR